MNDDDENDNIMPLACALAHMRRLLPQILLITVEDEFADEINGNLMPTITIASLGGALFLYCLQTICSCGFLINKCTEIYIYYYIPPLLGEHHLLMMISDFLAPA